MGWGEAARLLIPAQLNSCSASPSDLPDPSTIANPALKKDRTEFKVNVPFLLWSVALKSLTLAPGNHMHRSFLEVEEGRVLTVFFCHLTPPSINLSQPPIA